MPEQSYTPKFTTGHTVFVEGEGNSRIIILNFHDLYHNYVDKNGFWYNLNAHNNNSNKYHTLYATYMIEKTDFSWFYENSITEVLCTNTERGKKELRKIWRVIIERYHILDGPKFLREILSSTPN